MPSEEEKKIARARLFGEQLAYEECALILKTMPIVDAIKAIELAAKAKAERLSQDK